MIGTGREVILRPIWISELEGGIREVILCLIWISELEGGYLSGSRSQNNNQLLGSRVSSWTYNDAVEEHKSSAELETLFERSKGSFDTPITTELEKQ